MGAYLTRPGTSAGKDFLNNVLIGPKGLYFPGEVPLSIGSDV